MKKNSLAYSLIERVTDRFSAQGSTSELSEEAKRNLVIESLESRILFSGSPAPAPAPEPSPTAQEAPATENSEPQTPVSDTPQSNVAAPPQSTEQNQETAPSHSDGVTALALSEEEVAAVAEAATQLWIQSGLSEAQANALGSARYQVSDLEGNQIGSAEGNLITLDIDAAGRDWFIDSTPLENEEFFLNGAAWSAIENGTAQGRIDLLTAILHEQGHLLGIGHGEPGDLMFEVLGTGDRRLPIVGLADHSDSFSLEGEHALVAADDPVTAIKIDFSSAGDLDLNGGSLADWNQFATVGTIPAGSLIRHGDGAVVAGVSVTLSGATGFNNDPASDGWGGTANDPYYIGAANDLLFHNGTTTVSFAGLDNSASYNLRVYALINQPGQQVDISVTDGAGVITRENLDRGTTFATVPLSEDLIFEGISTDGSGNLVLSLDNDGGFFALNAVVLQKVEAYTTDEDTPLNQSAPGLFDNDEGANLTVVDFDRTSALGADVIVNDDGSFTYDPTSSAALDSLAEGAEATDSFSYTISEVPLGRFIRVQNNGTVNRQLHIGEIEVFAPGVVPEVNHAAGTGLLNPTTDLANFLRGASVHSKGATSGFYNDHGGDDDLKLIDSDEEVGGDTFGIGGVGAFVIIDLGANNFVDTVRIHQRNDGCCQFRLSDFTVTLLADDGTGAPDTSPAALLKAPSSSFATQPSTNWFGEVSLLEGSMSSTATAKIKVTGIDDAAIAVDDSGYMADEDSTLNVGVEGPQMNLALATNGGTATQSSTAAGGVAGRAIDGNTNGNYNSLSTTHTAGGAFQFWQVELGRKSHIDEITLFNRTDCCANRLTQIRVSVFDGDPDANGIEVFAFNHPGTVGSSLTIDVEAMDPNVFGTHIRVAIDPTTAAGDPGMEGDGQNGQGNTLSLAEVQVFGNPLTLLTANDIDPDNEIFAIPSTSTTTAGASVSVAADGSFSYDPNGQFESLAVGETATDTFTYGILDHFTDPLSTSFNEATLDPKVGLDLPNPAIGNITYDQANGELDFSASGNTDMWLARNNAPIAWTASPTVAAGKTWSVETEVRLNNIVQGQQQTGIGFYGDVDGGKPDFILGLDNWNPNARTIVLQGLGDNIPNVSVPWAGSSAFLKVEVTEGGATDTYNFFYKATAGDAWTQLGGGAIDYPSNFDNARTALFYKTGGARAGAAFTEFKVAELPADTATATVTVNGQNDAPTATSDSATVDENALEDTFVHQMVADDIDNGAVLTYAIFDGNTDNAFKINATTGEITVNNNAAIDYETNPTFGLTIHVTDEHSAVATATVSIGVNDAPAAVTVSTANPVDLADDNDIFVTTSGGRTVITIDGEIVYNAEVGDNSSITIHAGEGDDTLTINGGFLATGTTLNFNGEGQPVGGVGDFIVVSGGTVDTALYTFTNNNDGSLSYTTGTTTTIINYTGLEPVIDNANATDRVFTFTGGLEVITLANDAGAGMMTIDSTQGESVTFANPSASLTVNAGTGIDVVNINSLDAAFTGSLTVNGGADNDAVNVQGAISLGALTVTAENITLSGDVTTTGDQAYNGPVSLGGNRILSGANVTLAGTTALGASNLTIGVTGVTGSANGVISGGGGFTKTGTGTFAFRAANSYAGATNVNGGVLLIGTGGTVNTGSTITVNNTGTLRFGRNDTWGIHTTDVTSPIVINAGGTMESGGFFNTLRDLTLNGGTVALTGGANAGFPAFAFKGTVTVGGAATSQINTVSGNFNRISLGDDTFGTTVFDVGAGSTLNVDGILQNNAFGGLGLSKIGDGLLNLTAANTYTGLTTVEAGTLRVNGSINSSVTVNELGTLGGSGTITGNVIGEGTFAPGNGGNSPGVMTINGNFTPTGTIQFDVNPPSLTAGADFDQYIVNGTVDLTNATLNFTGNAGVVAQHIVTLIANNLGDATTEATSRADGSTVTINGNDYLLFYNAGDGNDVVLQFLPTVVYVEDTMWSGFTQGQSIADADYGIAGNQEAYFGVNAFSTIAAAQAVVAPGGLIVIRDGSYGALALAGTTTARITGNTDMGAGTVTVSSLAGAAGNNLALGVTGAAATLITGDASSTTFGGILSGPGALTKLGAGTQTLTGNNTYTGATTVTDGILQIGNGGAGGALASASNVSVSAAASIRWDKNVGTGYQTIGNSFSGAGTLELKGYNSTAALQVGIYDLTGNNSALTGVISLDGSLLWQTTSSNELGSAEIQIGQNATMGFNGGTFGNDIVVGNLSGWHHNVSGDVVIGAIRLEGTNVLNGNITLNNTTSVVNGDGTGAYSAIGGYSTGNHTFNGVISGAGDLSMSRFTSWNGGSTQNVNFILAGAQSNTYTGKTIVDGQGTKASLILAKTGGAVAIAGGTTVQMGSATGGQSNLRMSENEQFGADVVMNFVNAAGQWTRFDLQGTTQTLAGINGTTGQSGVIQNERVGGGGTFAPATLTLDGSGTYSYSGFLRDRDGGASATIPLRLVKEGTGTQSLGGANIVYTGLTTVEEGTLELISANVGRGAFTINDGGILSSAAGNAIDSITGTITINEGGLVRQDSGPDNIRGQLVLNGGTLGATVAGHTNYGNWVLSYNGAPGVVVGGTSTSTISADVRVGGNQDRVFQVNDTGDASGIDLDVTGPLRHLHSVSWGFMTKTGTGTMQLSNAGNTIGRITVSDGELIFLDSMAGMANGGLINNAVVEARIATVATFAQPLSGTGVFNKTGAGTLHFNGAGQAITTSGQFNILEGKLQNNNNTVNWSGSTADMDISLGATLDLYADPIYVDRLTGRGTVTSLFGNTGGYSGSSPSTERLYIGVDGGSSEFEGVITDSGNAGSGVNQGRLEVVKMGAGEITLSGANTYKGVTTIDGGTLLVNGTHTGAGAYTVNNTATLGGNGSTDGTVTVQSGATVAPGTGPGILSTGSVTFTAGSSFDVEINGNTAGPDPGGYDQLDVTGTVTIDTAADLVTSGTFASPVPGDIIIIINNDGTDAVVGNFNGLTEGSIVNLNGHDYRIFYAGGDGNDVVLAASPPLDKIYVDDSFTQNGGQIVTDADLGTTGNQTAIFGINAFTTIADALATVTLDGTIIVNGGTYNETVALDETRTMEITGPDAAQTVIIDAVESIAGTAIIIEGGSSLTVGDATDRLIAGTISGSGTLSKQGTGTVTLTGANTYSGGTTVIANSGILAATVSTVQNSIGNGAASIGVNSTIRLNNTSTAGGSSTVIGNTFTGSGTLNLNFAAGTAARGTTMNGVNGFGGTIQLSTAGATGDKWNTGVRNAPGASVVIDSGAQMYVNGASTFARVTITGTGNSENRGAIRLGSGLTAPITVNGNATIGSEGGFIDGSISTGVAGTSTLTVGTQNSPVNTGNMLRGLISNGVGTLAMNLFNQNTNAIFILGTRANTYSGGTTLLNSSSGTRLRIDAVSSTPYGTGDITIGQAPTDRAGIYFTTANQTLINGIVFNTTLGTDRPGVRVDTTNLTITGQITANLSDALFSTNSTGSVNLTGKVTGTNGLNLDNQFGSTITVTLDNAAENNDYTGTTNVEAGKGILVLGRSNQIPNGAGTGNVQLDGILRLNGFSDAINGLSGAGTLNGVSGTPTLTVGDNNAGGTFSGVIQNSGGTLELVKIGTGTQTLSGVNTYSGNTTVEAGVLVLTGGSNNNIANSPLITLRTAGTLDVQGLAGGRFDLLGTQTLQGDGTVQNFLNALGGSALTPGEPGNSDTGILTVGRLETQTGSLYHVNINGTTAGTGYDQIDVVNGTVTLNDSTLELGVLGYSPAANDTFTIINNDGADAVTGQFIGLNDDAYVSTPTGGGTPDQLFQISYDSGDGNDVVLTATGLTVTTNVWIDGDGNLRVQDILGDDTDDNLRISYDSALMAFVVEELTPANTLGTLVVGANQASPNRIEIPEMLVTGGVIVETFGGNDSIRLGDFDPRALDGQFTMLGGDDFDIIIQEAGAAVTLTDANAPGNPGAVTYTAETIFMGAGSSLTTSDGDVTLTANAGGAAGTFKGIELDGASISTGSGDVVLTGSGGDTGGYNRGVLIQLDTATGARSVVDSGGALTLTGTGGGDTGQNQGVGVFGSDLISAGLMTLDGQGGGGTSLNAGVYLVQGSTATSGGGVDIDGTGGAGGRYGKGVIVSASDIEATGGDISIDGTGAGAGGSGVGVELYASDVQAGGGGDIEISGTAASGSRYDSGVKVHATSVGTAGGDIDITGTGAGALRGHGVEVSAAGSLTTSAGGSITVAGTGAGSGGIGVYFNNSGASAGTGGIDIDGEATGASGNGNKGVYLTLGNLAADGAITIDGTGSGNGSSSAGVEIKATTLNATGAGGIVAISGAGGVSGTSLATGVALNSATVTAAGGGFAISLSGAGGGTTTSNYGVYANASTLEATGLGGISMGGTGGAGTSSNYGVYTNNSVVETAAGDIAIDGTSSGTTSRNKGVYSMRTTIDAGGPGGVAIHGTGSTAGAGYGAGVELSTRTTVSASGTGDVTITGTGGGSGTVGRSQGAKVAGASRVSAAGGAVSIAGTGGEGGVSNDGVAIEGASSVSSGGAGGITLTGQAGAGTSNNDGVYLAANTKVQASGGGGVSVAGTGAGTHSYNRGVDAVRATVTAAGAGTISISGTASQASSGLSNDGVLLQTAKVTTAGGSITINGVGGTGTNNNKGVKIATRATLDAGAGNLIITGTASALTTGTRNYGVDISNSTIGGGAASSITGSGGGLTSAAGNYNHGAYLNGVTALGSIAPGMVTGTAGFGAKSEDTEGNFFNVLPAALLAAGAGAGRPGRKLNGRDVIGILFARLRRLGTFDDLDGENSLSVFRITEDQISTKGMMAELSALESIMTLENFVKTDPAKTRQVLLVHGEFIDTCTGFAAQIDLEGSLLAIAPIQNDSGMTVGEFLCTLNGSDTETLWSSSSPTSDQPINFGRTSRNLSAAFGLE